VCGLDEQVVVDGGLVTSRIQQAMIEMSATAALRGPRIT